MVVSIKGLTVLKITLIGYDYFSIHNKFVKLQSFLVILIFIVGEPETAPFSISC